MEPFDYIVVGAGSAGCVLASRLSERPDQRVLLLEAGGSHETALVDMPIGYGKAMYHPRLSWGYLSEPDPGAGGRRHRLPRGRVLGGSSSINGLVYIRGQHADYDAWAAAGATGWNFDEVLPYFLRLEDQVDLHDEWHASGGPLYAGDIPLSNPVSDAIIEAFVAAGIPRNRDFNGARQEGVGFYQCQVKGGRRWSAARAYLDPARRRPNLRILTNAQAARILFSDHRAVGVEYTQGGRRMQARAHAEVLLATGTYGSPQLLMVSGIGPGQHLAELGIECLVDRPEVGANLQDHAGIVLSWRLRPGAASLNPKLRGWGLLREVLKYAATRTGTMTLATAHVGAFIRSTPGVGRPDLQYHALPVSGDVDAELRGEAQKIDRHPGMTFAVCAMRPASRGSVRLAAASAAVPPRIDTGFFRDERDLELTRRGIEWAERVVAQPPLAALVESRTVPPPDLTTRPEEMNAYCRSRPQTLYHPVGTCRMGSDETAVVDPQLRVRGVEGLRVIDASVMPLLTSGNTHAPTVMIAEKAVDLIRSATART
ncbi:MAG: GMC family oxidoreductase N-terminal domain-containing protein [Gammaproteobacteria bacterium]|nr:GMC family oxidoreductase N-terminal domain-containing protein [Gammaproteobacteria bacterium]